MTQKNSFCFCTLALGQKYRSLASLLAKDIELYSPGTPFIILTDKPQDFKDFSNVLVFKHHQHHVYPYNDKRFVIHKAISMFEICIFIDADMRILEEVLPNLEWLPGITARTGCSIIKHNQDRGKEYEIISKMAKKLALDLENVKFVHEFLFTLKRDAGREMEFLKQWELIAPYFELNGIYSGEGNVMGFAAAKAGLPVRFESVDRIAFFKDRIERVRIKAGQVDANEKKQYFDEQSKLEFPKQTPFRKALVKLVSLLGYLYRSLVLKIVALKHFNLYYR